MIWSQRPRKQWCVKSYSTRTGNFLQFERKFWTQDAAINWAIWQQEHGDRMFGEGHMVRYDVERVNRSKDRPRRPVDSSPKRCVSCYPPPKRPTPPPQ